MSKSIRLKPEVEALVLVSLLVLVIVSLILIGYKAINFDGGDFMIKHEDLLVITFNIYLVVG